MQPTRFSVKCGGAGDSVGFEDLDSGTFIGLICLERCFPTKYDDLTMIR